ncbi:hypothetical protein ACFC9N_14995 [Enterococcus casseliflavus]|uniref:hypothetical protein n=1 Tax=Enterococcus casseliflavus TaxID=37734 RepID=UPI0039A5624F
MKKLIRELLIASLLLIHLPVTIFAQTKEFEISDYLPNELTTESFTEMDKKEDVIHDEPKENFAESPNYLLFH